jgi:hypothetical protein
MNSANSVAVTLSESGAMEVDIKRFAQRDTPRAPRPRGTLFCRRTRSAASAIFVLRDEGLPSKGSE